MILVTRRWWLLAIAGTPAVLGLGAIALSVRLDGDQLKINAPAAQFLAGKPLERLHDGNTVSFLGQLSVTTGQNIVQVRSIARFALSYDIWQQTFSATMYTPGPGPHPSARNLSAQAAQQWCLDNLKIDASRVPGDRPFWVHLEVRSEDPHDANGIIGQPGISISGLLELISRPPRPQQQRVIVDSGPFTLADLRRTKG